MVIQALLLLAHLLPGHLGRGTSFAPPSVDRHNRGGFACQRHVTSPEARALFSDGAIVAHPTLPCASLVTVCSLVSFRCARAVVGDRGPVHALVDLWHVLARRLAHLDGPVLLLASPVRPVA